MSEFKNPFSDLLRREYNITNIKKILETFPTSLDVKQLTSTQLLERLRELVDEKNARIEELLARLQNQGETQQGLSDIDDEITKLRDSLQIGDKVSDSLDETVRQARINSLLQRGYVRIRETPLYVAVNKDLTRSDSFYIRHTDENAGFPESDLKAPDTVSFVNISETEDVWIKKEEEWQRDIDGFFTGVWDGEPLPERFTANGFGPTNAFYFRLFPDLHTTAYKIPADSEILSPMSLYYRAKDDYKEAGLKRRGDTNEWYGFMNIKVKVGTASGIDNIPNISIGNMRLYRDKN